MKQLCNRVLAQNTNLPAIRSFVACGFRVGSSSAVVFAVIGSHRARLANHFLARWGLPPICYARSSQKLFRWLLDESDCLDPCPARVLPVWKGASIPLKNDHQRNHLCGFWCVNLWDHQSRRPRFWPGNNSHRGRYWRLVGGLESPAPLPNPLAENID